MVDGHFNEAGGVFGVGLDQMGGDVFRGDAAQQFFAVFIAAPAADDGAVRAQRAQAHQHVERRAAQHFAVREIVPQYFAETADFHGVYPF